MSFYLKFDIKVYMNRGCNTKFFARKIDACKLEEIATTNLVLSVVLDLFHSILGIKLACPMGPIPFRVQIIKTFFYRIVVNIVIIFLFRLPTFHFLCHCRSFLEQSFVRPVTSM